MQQQAEPKPTRPYVPEYGIPDTKEGLLSWSHVCQRMEKALNYWINEANILMAQQPRVL